MPTFEEIQKSLQEMKPYLQTHYAITDLGVFGSYLRNEANETSDLDLLVDFSKTITMFQFARLSNELSDKLGINVDLVMRDSLKPSIADHILAEVKYL